MKVILLSLLLLISTDPREIAKVNSLKKEAEKAYNSGNYELAAERYAILDSLGVNDPALKLNLAHSYYNLNDTTGAKSNYQSVLNSPDKRMRSVAYQQLGVMQKDANKLEEALQYLKSSLKADPANSGARYDYEVVKKLLEEQKKQEQEQEQNQENEENQENKDEQKNSDEKKEGDENEEQEKEEGEKEESEEKKDGEKEEGENEEGEEQEADEEPTPEEQMQQKLEEMNISEEKARMILEAMRNNEVQYLQQQRRKATKRPDSGKPDW